MSSEDTVDQKEALMMSLIMMLSENAWTMLGKRVNPATGEEEKNLEIARVMIDMLDVLRERTESTLTARERQLLQGQLTNLRLNYVEESSGDDGDSSAASEGDSASSSPGSDSSRRIILPGE